MEGKTKTIEERLTVLDTEKNELVNALSVANKLKNFDIDFSDLKDSHYISAIAGKMPNPAFEKFKKEVEAVTDKIVISEHSEDKDSYKTIILVTLKEFSNEVSSLLRKYEFELYDISGLSGKTRCNNQKFRIQNWRN